MSYHHEALEKPSENTNRYVCAHVAFLVSLAAQDVRQEVNDGEVGHDDKVVEEIFNVLIGCESTMEKIPWQK